MKNELRKAQTIENKTERRKNSRRLVYFFFSGVARERPNFALLLTAMDNGIIDYSNTHFYLAFFLGMEYEYLNFLLVPATGAVVNGLDAVLCVARSGCHV